MATKKNNAPKRATPKSVQNMVFVSEKQMAVMVANAMSRSIKGGVKAAIDDLVHRRCCKMAQQMAKAYMKEKESEIDDMIRDHVKQAIDEGVRRAVADKTATEKAVKNIADRVGKSIIGEWYPGCGY